MDYTSLAQAVLSMGGIGLVFALLLALANKKLKVEEDPKIEKVEDLLPGANCGACGLPGCSACAVALVNGKVDLSICPVADASDLEEIGQLLGLETVDTKRQVAVVLCQGGNTNVKKKAEYDGIKTCLGATFASGGERACNYGCIGYGDCVAVCPFDAIHMNKEGLPVVDRNKCTGCNNCVLACPRNVIELHPVSSHVFVLCNNKDSGKNARQVCKTACIACKICVKADESGGFEVKDNLAFVDHTKYDKEYEIPTEKCPTKAIVIVGDKGEK